MPKEKEEMIKNSSAQVSIEFTSNDIKVKPEPHTQIATIQDEQNQNKTQLQQTQNNESQMSVLVGTEDTHNRTQSMQKTQKLA